MISKKHFFSSNRSSRNDNFRLSVRLFSSKLVDLSFFISLAI